MMKTQTKHLTFLNWAMTLVLAFSISVLSSCSKDDDGGNNPKIEDDYVLVNGDKWYVQSSSNYCNYFSNSEYNSDLSYVIVWLSSKEWDMNHYFQFTFYLKEFHHPTDLQKGTVLEDNELLRTGATITIDNQTYNLERISGKLIFQHYDSQRKKVKLSLDNVVFRNAAENRTFTLNGDMEIDYKEQYQY